MCKRLLCKPGDLRCLSLHSQNASKRTLMELILSGAIAAVKRRTIFSLRVLFSAPCYGRTSLMHLLDATTSINLRGGALRWEFMSPQSIAQVESDEIHTTEHAMRRNSSYLVIAKRFEETVVVTFDQ